MITFEYQRSTNVSHWYAMRWGCCVGSITKFDDFGGDINPFKVSRVVAGEYKPWVCFWNPGDKPIEDGGYFENRVGGLIEAKKLLTN